MSTGSAIDWKVAQHRCVGNCDIQEDVPKCKLWADLGGQEWRGLVRGEQAQACQWSGR